MKTHANPLGKKLNSLHISVASITTASALHPNYWIFTTSGSLQFHKKNMNFIALIFFLTVNWSLLFLGLLLNLFIVIINFTWWLKGKALQAIDIIMTSLGSIRILLLVIYLCVSLSLDLVPRVDIAESHSYLIAAVLFVVFCSLWWGTVLGVFYCVKITNFRNQLFLRLKMHVSSMIPWMLIGSMVISFISCLPCIWATYAMIFTSTDNGNISSNGTMSYLKTQYLNLILISVAGAIIPFLIFCISIYLLILSVLKHTKNMKSNNSGFSKPKLEAHKNAIINMVSFLFFYLLYFVGSKLLLISLSIREPIFFFMCLTCVTSYPSLHSIILIANNTKLKRSILSAFRTIF